MIPEIPEEQVTSENGYYHGVCIIINFNKEDIVYSKQEQVDVEQYPGQEGMEYVKLDDERKHQWRIFFKDNDGGVENKKALIHYKRWDVSMN